MKLSKFKIIIIFFILLLLTSCQNNDEKIIRLEICDEENTIDDKELNTSLSLERLLEEEYGAVFNNNMLIELAGLKEDPGEGKYWLFYINEEFSNVGIPSYKLKNGDNIKISLEKINDQD